MAVGSELGGVSGGLLHCPLNYDIRVCMQLNYHSIANIYGLISA